MIGSLFSGIGGLEMGLESLGLGPVAWQCDSDPYARAVLTARWPQVRRYEDVKEIDERAQRVDIICGGFPCQDISNAGGRVGIHGPRSGLWFEYARIVRILRPRIVFVENVAALASRGLDVVLGSLADLGYDAEWDVFSASQVGAPHIRKRMFVLAYSDREFVRNQSRRIGGAHGSHAQVAAVDGGERHVADAHGEGELQPQGSVENIGRRPGDCRRPMAHADRAGLAIGSVESSRTELATTERDGSPANTWTVEPDVGRVAHGVPARTHRLRLLGNACIPQQAAHAFESIAARIE